MKIALLLSVLCAAAIFSGCSTTNRGGTADEYDSSSGAVQMAPSATDPSLPPDPYAGPSLPPP